MVGTIGGMVPVDPATALDAESARWLRVLRADGREYDEALARLHGDLLRIARNEANRRAVRYRIAGPELDDLAHQAAADALLAISRKLGQFRGESRFTTWAYAFVVFEVSAKLGRHFWRDPGVRLDAQEWDRLPDRFGVEPDREADRRALVDAVRDAVDTHLTDRQRQVFVALVVDGVPLDALATRMGSSRGALYKTLFDARRKIRAALVANGQLDDDNRGSPAWCRSDKLRGSGAAMTGWQAIDRFLRTDPRDVGCDEAMAVLHVYVELVAGEGAEVAARRYPGVAAHLAACGPCAEDFDGLLATVAGTDT